MKLQLRVGDVEVTAEYYGLTGFGGEQSAHYLLEASYWDRVEFPSARRIRALGRHHLKRNVTVADKGERVLVLYMAGGIRRKALLQFFVAVIDASKYLGKKSG
ncbi:MAG: hypothetical protein RIQ56_712 [Candidatus Parcubacteria bacterium]|jgi:hypothetical protein